MANIKKEIIEKVTGEVKINKENTESVNIIEKEDENSALRQTIADMTKQMQDMQKMMISMQSTQSNNKSNTSTNTNNKVSIGCRFINGVTIYSPNRDVEIYVPYGEDNTVEFTDSDMNTLLKSKFVKDFLSQDILYFTNESDYQQYFINNRFYMNDESIIKLVSGDIEDIRVTLDKYTNSKRNDPVMHCLFYRIVNLTEEGKLTAMKYGQRKEIEDYFGFKIEDALMRLMYFNQVR